MEFAGKQSKEGSPNMIWKKEKKREGKKKSIVKYHITLLTSLKLACCWVEINKVPVQV